ncbi:MAG TPA: TlpA disulfide reductase family protein [Dehalococcoidia bacterium]|nr:TlpA disulfide reductase family protein [Dehalococcoidia bacterium]
MQKYINWRRAASGAAVTALLLLPLYLLVLRPASTSAIEPAILLDTSPGGATTAVGVAEGKLAPDFEISPPEGPRFRLSDLRGRPVLINFWATWCGSCLSEMPVIKQLQEERGLDTFAVLAVNAGETPRQAQEFIDFLEAPFLYGLDIDMRVTDAYGVYGLPLSVFVDASGVVQALYRGHADKALLTRLLDAASAATPPGEIAPVLRIVSTIPRERLLVVKAQGSRLVSESRTLRCDLTYCAGDAVQALREVAGVKRVDFRSAGGSVKLTVEFDRRVIDGRALAEELARRLEASPDPLYEGPVLVRYEGG